MEALRNLKLWLQRWLDHAGDQPSRLQQLYGQNPDFWTQFVILFTKLITKGYVWTVAVDSLSPVNSSIAVTSLVCRARVLI